MADGEIPISKAAPGLLWLSAAIWLALGLEQLEVLPGSVTGLWSPQRHLWFLAAVLLPCVAVWLTATAKTVTGERSWRPEHPGPRFQLVRFYTRDGCHLCDDALETLRFHEAWLGPIEVVDIDGSPELQQKFGEWVPVIECDGKVRFRGRVSLMLLRRLINHTDPRMNRRSG